jgi:endonuclease VIII
MPEGPEIRLAADKIATAIVNQPITEVFFAFESLQSYAAELARSCVISVRPRGKALLTRFDNGWTIYSHNQLYGVWYVRKAKTYPNTNRQLRLAIHTPKKSALLYSASDILVLNDDDLAIHPFLQKLGPDVLDETLTAAEVEARLLDKRFVRRGFPTLLLDQQFVCGLGNYLRSEVLFLAGIHPTARPIDCTPAQIHKLAQAIIDVPRQSYATKGITNDLTTALTLKAQGKPRWFYRHWVFSRTNQLCYSCGDTIVKDAAGGRRVYYCPTCQATPN